MTPTRSRWLVWLAAALTFALTFSLGCWQLRRADQKQAAQDTLMQRRLLPAWGNADWPCDLTSHRQSPKPELPSERPVHLQGRWLLHRTVYLDNRPMDGQSGFFVITPLQLDPSPTCGQRIVLVQRGWVPRNSLDRLRLPPVHTPAGLITVQGRVMPHLSRAYALGDEPLPAPTSASAPAAATETPLVRQNADVAFWQAWLGQALLPGAVLQVQARGLTENDPVLRRHWPEPVLGKDKNLAYAAQWFAMSAVIAVLFVWFQVIRPRRQVAHVQH